MQRFEIGKTYQTRSIGDHDCIISITVEARTAKTITTRVHGQVKTLRIAEYEGAEQVKPWGSYSMAPIITAADGNAVDPLMLIARERLQLETLETRNRDALDFHEFAVWDIRAALQAAYDAGKAAK